MTTSKETEKKPLKLNRPGRLELKKTVETGQVRQSFSHGRSKAVTVEVKRKRTFAPGAGGRMREVTRGGALEGGDPAGAAAAAQVEGALAELAQEPARQLTEAERAVRMRALETAKHEEEARRLREAEEAEERAKQEAEAKRIAEEEAKRKEAEDAARAVEEAARPAEPEAEPEPAAAVEAAAATPAARAKARDREEEESAGRAKARKTQTPKASPNRRGEGRRRQKLTISRALEEDDQERQRSLTSLRRQRERQRALERQANQPPSRVIRGSSSAGGHYRPRAGQSYGRAGRRSGQSPDEAGRHGHDQSDHRCRHGIAGDRRVRSSDAAHLRFGCGARNDG